MDCKILLVMFVMQSIVVSGSLALDVASTTAVAVSLLRRNVVIVWLYIAMVVLQYQSAQSAEQV